MSLENLKNLKKSLVGVLSYLTSLSEIERKSFVLVADHKFSNLLTV